MKAKSKTPRGRRVYIYWESWKSAFIPSPDPSPHANCCNVYDTLKEKGGSFGIKQGTRH
jgi:hypothetical protein